MVRCLECDKDFSILGSLHRHLKAHEMGMGQYYQKHFPRYDKFDGSIIEFTDDLDTYRSTDFNSKTNMFAWFKSTSPEEAKEYVKNYLRSRMIRKNMKFVPSQVELRSLMIPGRVYLESLLGDYVEFCASLGLQKRYGKREFVLDLNKFNAKHHILCDTREQLPLSFPTLIRNYEGLKFGDYRLNDDEFTHYCCIERKSLNDFYTTISSGYYRFIKEIERAKEAGFNLIVLVEAPLGDLDKHSKRLLAMLGHNDPEETSDTPKPANLSFVLHNMREICQAYSHVQFLFVNDRKESALAIEHIFRSNGEYKEVDLQYLYDKGALI